MVVMVDVHMQSICVHVLFMFLAPNEAGAATDAPSTDGRAKARRRRTFLRKGRGTSCWRDQLVEGQVASSTEGPHTTKSKTDGGSDIAKAQEARRDAIAEVHELLGAGLPRPEVADVRTRSSRRRNGSSRGPRRGQQRSCVLLHRPDLAGTGTLQELVRHAHKPRDILDQAGSGGGHARAPGNAHGHRPRSGSRHRTRRREQGVLLPATPDRGTAPSVSSGAPGLQPVRRAVKVRGSNAIHGSVRGVVAVEGVIQQRRG